MATLDEITRKNLILVRELYSRALIQAETKYSYVDRILAIIGFDLAIETALRTVVSTLDPRRSPADGFQGVIQQADNVLLKARLPEVPDKAKIQRVHNFRNDAQHEAKYPNEIDISDSRTYARDFLTQIILNVWQEQFASINLVDLITDPKVKGYLNEAGKSLLISDYKGAVIKAMAALDWTIDEVKDSIVGRIPYAVRAFVVSDGTGITKESTQIFQVFEHMRELIMRSAIGISLPEYRSFEKISESVVQGISFFKDGGYNVRLGSQEPTKTEAEYIVTFSTNAVLQIERLVGNIKDPFGN